MRSHWVKTFYFSLTDNKRILHERQEKNTVEGKLVAQMFSNVFGKSLFFLSSSYPWYLPKILHTLFYKISQKVWLTWLYTVPIQVNWPKIVIISLKNPYSLSETWNSCNLMTEETEVSIGNTNKAWLVTWTQIRIDPKMTWVELTGCQFIRRLTERVGVGGVPLRGWWGRARGRSGCHWWRWRCPSSPTEDSWYRPLLGLSTSNSPIQFTHHHFTTSPFGAQSKI